MSEILNIDEFCENLQEVTSSKIFLKNKFNPEGLFSEQIFGPLQNYTCQCRIYHGISQEGGKCKECKVDIVNSNERRRRFAKIKLPLKVVNPLFFDLLINLSGKSLKGSLDLLMRNEESFLYKDGIDYVVTVDKSSIPVSTQRWEKLEAIHTIVEGLTNELYNDLPDWKIIHDNLHNLFIEHVIVLPPDLRPSVATKVKGTSAVDTINRFYGSILTIREDCDKISSIELYSNKQMFYTFFRQLQKNVNELYSNFLSKLSKKEGLIRGNILGKRMDFSGRAVIIPDPTIKISQCVLPYIMVVELFKLQIVQKLIESGKFVFVNNALTYIEECIYTNNPVLFELCVKFIQNKKICILNRQPTLHRLGLVAFDILISMDKVIKIHPLVCPGFNADFDGDQMAVYIPISEESEKEAKEVLHISNHITDPANGSLATIPNQDIILGCYILTTNKLQRFNTTVECKGKVISKGREIFNNCLPSDYPVIDYGVGKKELINIIDDIKENYYQNDILTTLDNIKACGFLYATIFGSTMSLNGFRIENIKQIKNDLYLGTDITTQLERVSGSETENVLKENFDYSYMIESGSRGSWDQARQILLTRGFISNFNGEILSKPIKNSLIEGLTQEEFFDSTYGCRKGLLDVALNTGVSGYLSRKLIFTSVNLQLSENLEDCKTTDYLEVYVDSLRTAQMLEGRYMKIEDGIKEISKDIMKDLVEKTILIRSPIYCESEHICKVCYGNLYKIVNSRFIGVVAAQSLSECNTQLVLRTFHTSGVAAIRDGNKDMVQMDIVSSLQQVSKLLHKSEDRTPSELTKDLFALYNTSKRIHYVHFECIVSQLMWYGNKKWRLVDNRKLVPHKYYSVQTVPSLESWLLGLAFSNPKKHIIDGILKSTNYTGIIDKILQGKRI